MPPPGEDITRGQKRDYFKCRVVEYVPVTGGDDRVTKRYRIQGSWTLASLNSRLGSNKEERKKGYPWVAWPTAWNGDVMWDFDEKPLCMMIHLLNSSGTHVIESCGGKPELEELKRGTGSLDIWKVFVLLGCS